jgi:hypothetical protein
MFLTQTIVVHIDLCRAYEDVNEKGEKSFIQTELDAKIAEFTELVESEGGQVSGVAFAGMPDYLVAFVSYIDNATIKKLQTQSKISIPSLKLQ